MRVKLVVLGLAVALVGCQGVSDSTASAIDQVQAITTEACRFLPTVETVSAIIAKDNATLSTAAEIAAAICATVSTRAVSRTVPTIEGVPIEGQRV